MNAYSFARRALPGSAGVALMLGVLSADVSVVEAQTPPVATTNAAKPLSATEQAAGDAAWRAVRRAAQPPFPPVEWQTNRPPREIVAEYYRVSTMKAVDLARDFHQKYPGHSKAVEARKLEHDLLNRAVTQFGETNQTARLEILAKEFPEDAKAQPAAAAATRPVSKEEEKLRTRLAAIEELMQGVPKTLPELEKAAVELQHDFPNWREPYQVLVQVIFLNEGDKARAMAREFQESKAPAQFKAMVTDHFKQMERVGQPLDIKFTATDGRAVDLAALKGKVVLVDFWATWCGPCVGEVPHVREAYTRLHDRGFEIIGISLDQDKDKLTQFIKKEKMPWPQHFEDGGEQNHFAKEFGIESIPTMWLVDKLGRLNSLDARDGLAARVEKLLAQ